MAALVATPTARVKRKMPRHAVSISAERPVLAFEAAPPLREPSRAGSRSPPPEPSVTAPPARKRAGRTLLLSAPGWPALAAAGYYGHDYWTVGRFEVSTDDAYVQADSTTIAPKVSGYIGSVLVGDNEPVKTGQVLARIDDRDYAVALDQAKADVAAAQAAVVEQAGRSSTRSNRSSRRPGRPRGRPGQARPSPNRTTSATRTWPRPAMAPCRTRSRRRRGSPPPRPRSRGTRLRSPPRSSRSIC